MKHLLEHIHIETKKLRYRHIGLLVFASLALELGWISYNFSHAEKYWSNMEYYGMLYCIPQMLIVFFPLTIAFVASRLCDLEHRCNNFKLLYTIETKTDFLSAKLGKGIFYPFIMSLSQFVVILLLGKVFHYLQSICWTEIIYFTLEVFVVSLGIFFMQLALSLLFENQMIPLIIGLMGSFFGLFSLFLPVQVSHFTIWGYYCILSPVSFFWDSTTREYTIRNAECNWTALLLFIFVCFILYLINRIIIKKKEV